MSWDANPFTHLELRIVGLDPWRAQWTCHKCGARGRRTFGADTAQRELWMDWHQHVSVSHRETVNTVKRFGSDD